MRKRSAVVTGAGGGIGRAVVHRLAKDGYRVTAVYRTEQSLRREKRRFEREQTPVDGVVADVSDGKAMRGRLGHLGPVHAVVANAGICLRARMGEPDSDRVFKEVIRVNLVGVYHTFGSILHNMADGGRMVAVSSGLGKVGRAGCGAYAASKHGVLGLVRCLALELAPRKITVNGVCPGWVDTEMAANDLAGAAHMASLPVEEIRAQAERRIPLGRFVRPEEVADLIGFLCSDRAAAITGQALNITGGELAA